MKTTRGEKAKTDRAEKIGSEPYRVQLPGFITEEIGLGDFIKRATSAVGIKPCGGCERRAAALNHWLSFSRVRDR